MHCGSVANVAAAGDLLHVSMFRKEGPYEYGKVINVESFPQQSLESAVG